VELESAQRCAPALQARIKQAAFPVYKGLDSYNFSLVPNLNKQKIVELTRCQWRDQHENLCLLGSFGSRRRKANQDSNNPLDGIG
jgi:DNA replication protein DnaC